jgi:predicted metal-dependent phosphoesterase TrpH
MPGDLHTHTTFSDGSTPADKLPFLAACAGMTHLAISDHDSIRSVRYAYAHPVQNGVHLIPATELTAYDYERAHRLHLPPHCNSTTVRHARKMESNLTH